MQLMTTSGFLESEIYNRTFITEVVNDNFHILYEENITDDYESFLYFIEFEWKDRGVCPSSNGPIPMDIGSIRYYLGMYTGPVDSIVQQKYFSSSDIVKYIRKNEPVSIKYYILYTAGTGLIGGLETHFLGKTLGLDGKRNIDFLNENNGGIKGLMKKIDETKVNNILDNWKNGIYELRSLTQDELKVIPFDQRRHSETSGVNYTDREHVKHLASVWDKVTVRECAPDPIIIFLNPNNTPNRVGGGNHTGQGFLESGAKSLKTISAWCVPYSDWKDLGDYELDLLSIGFNPEKDDIRKPSSPSDYAKALLKFCELNKLYRKSGAKEGEPDTDHRLVKDWFTARGIRIDHRKRAISTAMLKMWRKENDEDSLDFFCWSNDNLSAIANKDYQNLRDELISKKEEYLNLRYKNPLIKVISLHTDLHQTMNKYIFKFDGKKLLEDRIPDCVFFYVYYPTVKTLGEFQFQQIFAWYRKAYMEGHGMNFEFEYLPHSKTEIDNMIDNLRMKRSQKFVSESVDNLTAGRRLPLEDSERISA